jgi:hypothetical protein
MECSWLAFRCGQYTPELPENHTEFVPRLAPAQFDLSRQRRALSMRYCTGDRINTRLCSEPSLKNNAHESGNGGTGRRLGHMHA